MKRMFHLLQYTSGLKKLLFCFTLAVAAYFLLMAGQFDFKVRMILSWDLFCFVLLLLSWLLFFNTTSKELPHVVAAQDDGLQAIFMIVVVAVCFSLFGTILLFTTKTHHAYNQTINTVILLSPILLSWLALHTIFAVRYAHLYHDNDLNTATSGIGGIAFPTKEKPDYIDFAYFSFVIGMTFQVSDVQVTSRYVRRFVLVHSLISFVFNTIIVALTINTIASFQ